MAFSMVFRIRTDGGGQANFNKFGVFIFFQHDSGWGGQAEKERMDGWMGRQASFFLDLNDLDLGWERGIYNNQLLRKVSNLGGGLSSGDRLGGVLTDL